jgi:sigma-B regulation protein RsbU (phosphoserine phosphatase)
MGHDQADSPRAPALSGSTELAEVSPKGNILIVDDTPANLRLLSRMLAEQGYQVRPVPDGPLALAATRAEPPDLILLDIRMPEMNGYEVCEHLKADAQTRDIPIIFISALDEIGDKVKAFTVGGVDYVTKPFQFAEVLARVETHLALQKLQKQLQDANKKMERELALAGEVQASFLPRDVPDIPGWQLTATLRPARETSGDFYDFIPLPNGRLGIVVADVTDKGAGAALYMALSRTLIRTYAVEHATQPELALNAANGRILTDTHSDMFITVFYGILDPFSGTLSYCNAGHNPPYLFGAQKGADASGLVQALSRTGLPLGILEDMTWEQRTVQLAPGDALVLYTDGITEAQDRQEEFFGKERLLKVARASLGRSAQEMHATLLAEVYEFVGDAPQSDDIALMIVVRGSTGEQTCL